MIKDEGAAHRSVAGCCTHHPCPRRHRRRGCPAPGAGPAAPRETHDPDRLCWRRPPPLCLVCDVCNNPSRKTQPLCTGLNEPGAHVPSIGGAAACPAAHPSAQVPSGHAAPPPPHACWHGPAPTPAPLLLLHCHPDRPSVAHTPRTLWLQQPQPYDLDGLHSASDFSPPPPHALRAWD
jgi:hypothetical protein